jgi:hypothetical protein
MGHGIVLKGIVKYYGRGKNILYTFGHTAFGLIWTPFFAASLSTCSSHSSTNVLGFLTCRRGISYKYRDGLTRTIIVEFSGVFSKAVISLNQRCLL